MMGRRLRAPFSFMKADFLKIFVPAIFMASPLWAGCPDGSAVLVDCTLEGGAKTLTTCQVGDQVSYAFGRRDAPPDLALTRHVRDVDMTPWPGIGMSIWEDFTVHNRGYDYTVFYSFRREPGAEDLTAGVVVSRGGAELARITCDPGSIDVAGYGFPIFDAKHAAGQVWSREQHRWLDTE